MLKPGGVIVVLDSAQLTDAPELARSLEEFPRIYHEPYFRSYLRDDLADAMEECGFEALERRDAFVARVVIGRRRT